MIVHLTLLDCFKVFHKKFCSLKNSSYIYKEFKRQDNMNTLQQYLEYPENTKISELELEALADELLNVSWEIDVPRFEGHINLNRLGWKFIWGKKKRVLGTCRGRRKEIIIHEPYFQNNKHLSKSWEDTLRHEIAHAIDYETRGTSDHGYIWKCIAEQILAEPLSTSSDFTPVEGNYQTRCLKCGNIQYRHKRVRKINIACGFCCNKYNNGKFTDKFLLIFEDNPNVAKIEPKAKMKRVTKRSQIEDLLTQGITDIATIESKLGFPRNYIKAIINLN